MYGKKHLFQKEYSIENKKLGLKFDGRNEPVVIAKHDFE